MIPMIQVMRKLAVTAIAAASLLPVQATAQYTFESKFGSSGTQPGQFDAPRGVAMDNSGQIVISESGNNRIQICSDTGSCTAFGSFGLLSGEFDRPRGVTVSSVGNILIADRGNERIQECDASGTCTDFDGSPPLSLPFNSPRDVVTMPDGRVVISDTNNDRIVICDLDATTCTTFGSAGTQPGQFLEPTGVAVDSQGRIIIADRLNDRIQICNETGTSCSAFGSLGTSVGQFFNPADVDVDSNDRIVIADRFNSRIQVCTDGGSCSAFGSPGMGDGQFDEPWGVTVDANNRIIVVDSGNDRIQIFSEASSPDPVSIDSFTATPASIQAGEATTLSWTVSNATSCTASGDWSGSKNASSGSEPVTLNTAGSYTFNLDCSGDGDPDTASVGVTVSVTPPVVIDNLTATPANIQVGESTTISWNAQNATSCTASGGTGAWGGAVDPASGSIEIQIDQAGDYLFILACTDGETSDERSVMVGVTSVVTPFSINAGLADAWYNPETPGQGFLVIVLPTYSYMFIAWFTFEVEQPPESVEAIIGDPAHRWITAGGVYSGDTVVLDVEITSEGVFNQAEPEVPQAPDGTITLTFHDCDTATAVYDMPSAGLAGEIPIQRILGDNSELCELMADME